MKFGFKHIILAAALMSAGSLTAQEQNDKTSFQKYNWFVTGAVNGEWLSNTTGNMIVGGKVGAGIQLTRYSAFRINAFAGKNRVKTMRAQQYGAELDYMLTLVEIKDTSLSTWRLSSEPATTTSTRTSSTSITRTSAPSVER